MNVRLVFSADDETDKDRMLTVLRELLHDTFRMKNHGAAYAKMNHAQGYADGYMRALVEMGVVTHTELLSLIGETRRGVDGPATGTVVSEQMAAGA